ncbi:MAG: AAA family ATPase [Variovorax sp.]|nr:AAA family ATPase [Variovorax sp.]
MKPAATSREQIAASMELARAVKSSTAITEAEAASIGLNGHDLDARGVVYPQQATTPRRAPLAFVPLTQFRKGAELGWFIKGVLPRAALGAIYGQPGSGKSFFAIDIAMTLARGLPRWAGVRRCSPARVAYVVAEGASGFRHRLDGYLKHHRLREDEVPNLTLMDAAPNLLDPGGVDALIEAIRATDSSPEVLFVDTLSQVTPGAKEGASEDMGRALAACKRISEACALMVILITHSGKDETRGIRGWSGIVGALDVEIHVERKTGRRTAKITKLKDGEGESDSYEFSLQRIVLGTDKDGDEITTCVIEHEETSGAHVAPPSTDGLKRQVYQLLDSELAQGKRHSMNTIKPVAVEAGVGGQKKVADLVHMLIGDKLVAYWERPDWRERTPRDRNYLHPIGTSAPISEWGVPLDQAEATRKPPVFNAATAKPSIAKKARSHGSGKSAS